MADYLSDDEVKALGLEEPSSDYLSDDEVAKLGLDDAPAPERGLFDRLGGVNDRVRQRMAAEGADPQSATGFAKNVVTGWLNPFAGAARGIRGGVMAADELATEFLGPQQVGQTVLDATKGIESGASLGLNDEAQGAVAAFVRKMMGEKTGLNDLVTGKDRSFGGLYRSERDEERGQQHEAQERSPWAYGGGELAGGLSVPLPASKGATVMGRVGKSALTGLGLGAALGFGNSDADLTQGEVGQAALDTGLGAVAGGVGGALGQGVAEGVGKLASGINAFAGRKAAQARHDLDVLATERVGEQLRSLGGEAGEAAQKGNRFVENLMRLESSGSMTPTQQAELAALKASGQWDTLIQQLAESNLADLPGQAAEIQAKRALLSGAQANKQQAFAAARKEVANPMAQLMPRIKRYAAPAAAAVMGPTALAGAGIRPALQAAGRMFKHPSLRKPVFELIEAATRMNPSLMGKYGRLLAQAAEQGEERLSATHFVLAQQDPEYRKAMEDAQTSAEP